MNFKLVLVLLFLISSQGFGVLAQDEFFPGQECSAHFFQKIEGDNLIYLVDVGWGSKYGNDVCNFKTFHWIDDDNFLYSYLDYSSNSETGDVRYFKGELVQLR